MEKNSSQVSQAKQTNQGREISLKVIQHLNIRVISWGRIKLLCGVFRP